MPNLTGQSLGRYHILEQLGEGGMATVYKAYDTRLERDVAVKVIRVDQFAPAVLERILKRFEREAKSLARLTHPNIVHVNDYGEQDGVPYLVMDYLPGGTLKQRLGEFMPWQEAAKLLVPVAEALDYAHSLGIIHRDVKPSNILLTQRGQPMLTDFGIAKLLESEETQTLTGTGAGVGTPEYMAPEQGLGQKIDARADIYSLGVVLYELVTGRKPFQADTPMAVVVKQINDPLPRPGQFIHDLPEAVEKVLLKALAKKPEDRYTEMSAFAAAMESLLSGQTHTTQQMVNSTLQPPRMEAAQATIEQKATRDERLKSPAPSGQEKITFPQRENKKKGWWPWAIGVGGLGVLVCMAIAFLFDGSLMAALFPTSTPTSTYTPIKTNTPVFTETPTATIIPSPTMTASPSPTPTMLPNHLIDNTDDWLWQSCPSYADIVEASVYQTQGNSIVLSMKVNGTVPERPDGYLAFVWGLDTDNNSVTGYGETWTYNFSNDLGIDYLYRAAFSSGYWSGWLDKIAANSVPIWSYQGFPMDIQGDQIQINGKLDQIGSPSSFGWTVHTIYMNTYCDKAPNNGHGISP